MNRGFFAEVARPPVLERLGPEKFRVRFFSRRRLIGETAIIVVLGFLFAIWLMRYAGYAALAIPAILVIGYLITAMRLKQLDVQRQVEIDHGELYLGHPKPERVDAIEEILCVELSGHEDKERWESGSSRLYVRLRTAFDGMFIPLLISSTDLRPTARDMASAAKCPYRHGKGIAAVPKLTKAWARPSRDSP